MISPQDLQTLIEKKIHPSLAIVESEDGVHYEATVISALFEGKKLLERQRLVYAALNQHLVNGTVHALALKTYTELEWKKSQAEEL